MNEINSNSATLVYKQIYFQIVDHLKALIKKIRDFACAIFDKKVIVSSPYQSQKWVKQDIILSESAEESTAWKLKLMKAATSSIELSGNYCGGKIFDQFLTLFEEKLNDNPLIKISILTSSILLSSKQQSKLKKLHRNFPDRFNYVSQSYELNKDLYKIENHSKLLVVDEAYFVVGGTNVQDRLCQEAPRDFSSNRFMDKLLGAGSNDMDVIAHGKEGATILRKKFFHLFNLLCHDNRLSYFPVEPITTIGEFDDHPELIPYVPLKITTGGKGFGGQACTLENARVIQKADQALTIAHMYMHPVKEIRTALLEQDIPINVVTATKGVNLPGANSTYANANKLFCSKLMTYNDQTNVHFYNNGNNIFHKKVIVAQRNFKPDYITIGSYNLGGKSHLDYEIILTLKSDILAHKILNIINNDIEKSKNYASKQLEKYRKHKFEQLIGRIETFLFPLLFG